jgi:anti-sigma factor RsiW
MRSPLHRHPRELLLSRYLDGDLDSSERRALEEHIGGCTRCRGSLESLASTLHALGAVAADPPGDLADSVVAALRAEQPLARSVPPPSATRAGLPPLTLVRSPAQLLTTDGGRGRIFESARTAIRYCAKRRVLRLTVPIALLAGVVLTLVNQNGMVFRGHIDLGMCAMCAMDFVIPFVALNVVLLLVMRPPGRDRL